MKKKYSIIIVLLVLVFGTPCVNNANAQVFIAESDEVFSDRVLGTDFNLPMLPGSHDSTLDWTYAPIGNGLWLLGALGGAYLLGKRKKIGTETKHKKGKYLSSQPQK